MSLFNRETPEHRAFEALMIRIKCVRGKGVGYYTWEEEEICYQNLKRKEVIKNESKHEI